MIAPRRRRQRTGVWPVHSVTCICVVTRSKYLLVGEPAPRGRLLVAGLPLVLRLVEARRSYDREKRGSMSIHPTKGHCRRRSDFGAQARSLLARSDLQREVNRKIRQQKTPPRDANALQTPCQRKMILTNCAACAAPLAHNAPRCVRCHTRYLEF